MDYTNPRTKAIFDDWPIGRNDRGDCIFEVEYAPKRGERAIRTTRDRRGRWCKPKKGTYSPVTRIVDGDDGRTYVASITEYGFVCVMESNLKTCKESIHEGDERHADLVDLLTSSTPPRETS